MIPPLDLADLNRKLDEWCARIVEAEPTVADPERRMQLRHAMAEIRQGQAMVNAEYQKEIDSLAARTAAVQRESAETLAELEALKSRVDAPSAEVPVPPEPIDPARGVRLRDELLKHFATASPMVAARGSDAGDVAGIDSSEFSPRAVPPPGGHAEPGMEETPAPVIAALLQLARVGAGDVIYNLGCGDGRLLISAASKHGARGVGIDSKAAAIEAAHDNLRKARLTKLVTIDAGNPLSADVSSASVVVLGLGTKQNGEIRETLLRQLRPGARILTHQGGWTDWPPDEERVVQDTEGKTYRLRLWKVPERAGSPVSSIGNLSEGDWESRSK
jgi:SAM-dependent methyltransferase